jgi:hypothetical protein
MKSVGIALLTIGLVGMGAAFFFPVERTAMGSASEFGHIANLDRIAIRAMLHSTAGFCAVIGAVFFGTAHVRASTAEQTGVKPSLSERDYSEIDAIWASKRHS